jgi:recombination protein U
MLERTHSYYERAGVGLVEKIENAFGYCSEQEWQRLPAPLKARTGDGKPLKRQKTICDYMGHAYSLGVAFDAKEFDGPSIPLENFKDHQARRLFTFQRTKGLAGFLVWSKRVDEVYWVAADVVLKLKAGFERKSISIDWLRQKALLISKGTTGAIIDWARVLILPDGPKAA